jgi:DNA-binding GntR family transcriptional regulator
MPPYQQIAADLRRQIESGELAPGDMVPSITRLMQEYEVSKGTAVKALDVLRREGLTRTVAGWGTFVTER